MLVSNIYSVMPSPRPKRKARPGGDKLKKKKKRLNVCREIFLFATLPLPTRTHATHRWVSPLEKTSQLFGVGKEKSGSRQFVPAVCDLGISVHVVLNACARCSVPCACWSSTQHELPLTLLPYWADLGIRTCTQDTSQPRMQPIEQEYQRTRL